MPILLNTKTNITTSNGKISIYTFYQKCINYLNFWINSNPEKIDNVQFKEGELGYKIEGIDEQFYLNNSGDLIVSGVNFDAYSIDDNGNLLTTYDFCGFEILLVSFYVDGGSTIESISVENNSLIIRPEDPIKSGYDFAGWFSDSELTYEWNFSSDVVVSDITLYAKWEVRVNTIDVDFGLLYNWYAATDERNIANNGWRLPSLSDATNLINYVGEHGGGKLKNVGFIYWDEPNIGATNELNFNARGAGGRDDDGSFWGLKIATYIWNNDNGVRYTIETDYNNNFIVNNQRNSSYEAVRGATIRLIKDVTTLSHGQTGTYTGNDGRVYRTICIGTQEWLADNLCETKYRTGDIIPTVTDSTEWSSLTTGAKCAYNNDWSNVYGIS
jgi:uncharacterized protein (TIGR02145 family)